MPNSEWRENIWDEIGISHSGYAQTENPALICDIFLKLMKKRTQKL
jgi:hypothetical protein